jgi:hypothetical protein
MRTFFGIVAISTFLTIHAVISYAQVPKAWSIVASYDIPSDASGLAYDGTYLYSGNYGVNGDKIYRIDPTNGSYVLYFSGCPQEDAYGLTYDGTYLWTSDHPGGSTTPAIAIQLSANGTLLSSFNLPDHYMSGIAYDDGNFWVATYYDPDGYIYKVDNTGTIIKGFTAPNNQPWDLCLINGDLWMADYWGDMIYQIDTLSGNLMNSYPTEGIDPAGVAFDGTFLWYIDEGTGSFDKLYKVDLSGSGTPQINLPVSNYDFGTITVGQSGVWNMVVQNNGTADLTVTGIDITPGQNLTNNTTLPQVIAASGSVSFEIEFAPTDFSPLNAILSIASDDPVNPAISASVSGNGVLPGANGYIQQNEIDYGEIRTNAFTGRYIIIENSGDETLIIDEAVSNADAFIVGDDIGFPINIDVLGKDSIRIWFHPGTEASYSGILTLNSSNATNSPFPINITGTSNNGEQPIGNLLWHYTINEGYDNSPKAMKFIADISGDGVSDMIICSEDNTVRCFNGNSSGTADVLWKNTENGSVYQQNGIQVIEDLNEDGYADVIIGTAWADDAIVAVSGKTGENIWKYDTHLFGDGGWVYQVSCKYDYNNDGTPDVLAASGDDANGTGPKRIHCLDGKTGSVIWDYPSGGPNFSVSGISDCNGDGIPDVVCGSSSDDESQGYVFALDGSNGSLLWQIPVNGTSVWAVEEISDANNNGLADVIAGSFNFGGDGYIYVLDGENGSEIRSFTMWGASIILRFELIDDVNSNGTEDVLVASSGPDAVVYDPQTGESVWTFPVGSPDKPWNVARINDISGDGINDVLIGDLYTNNMSYFLDGTNGSVLHSISYGEPVDAIASIPDIVGDHSWEMVVGGREGNVRCFSGGLDTYYVNTDQAFEQALSIQTYPVPFHGCSFLTLDMARSGNVTIAVNNFFGQQVDQLYNGFLPQGRHFFQWTPKNVSNGTYYYNVQMNDRVYSSKIIYMR